MVALVGALFFAGIALAIYGLFFSGAASKVQAKSREKGALDSKDQEIYSRDQKIARLQKESESLSIEFERAKATCLRLEEELESSRQMHTKLTEDLAKRNEWVGKNDEALKKAKEDCSKLERQFLAKENELQDEFTKNVDLNRQIKEAKEKTQALEKESREKSEQIEASRHRIEALLQEVRRLTDEVSGIRKKEEITEWVPKAEFNRLNDEYTELENELEAKDERIKKLTEEIVRLNSLLKEPEMKTSRQDTPKQDDPDAQITP